MKNESLLMRAGRQIIGEKNCRSVARWVEHQDPRFRESMRRLRRFQNIHVGKRCFVLGNGPSLKQTDLTLLNGEYTFCTNRIYLMLDQLGFTPSYYVVVNDLIVEQCARDIEKLSMPKFVGWHNRDNIRFTEDLTFLWTRSGLRSWFYTDLTEGCWEGNTVTMACIQLAYYMGFKEVYLLGVDHSYQFTGTPHAEQVSEGDDPNHFAPNYFGKGFRWHLPDLEGSELAYRVANHIFKTSGRKICDATIDGKLEVFPKVNYHALFNRWAESIAA